MSYTNTPPGARVICLECGGDRELESQQPGVNKYKPCGKCGAVGIRWNTDTGMRYGKVLDGAGIRDDA